VISDDDQWAQVQSGPHSAEAEGQPLVVQAAILRDRTASLTADGTRLRIWRFYWVGGRFIGSDLRAKLLGAQQLLQGQGDDAAIIVLSTVLNDQLPEAERVAAADRVLGSFLQTQAVALRTALQVTQQER
jgi:EpsI family protein